MSIRKDLSINFLGVECENPFFLSSSPVGSNFEMVAKSFEQGWGGAYYKTVSIYIPDELSPRFDTVSDAGGNWIGFKNMEQTSDKPNEQNFEYIAQLKHKFPDKIVVSSIMGADEAEWKSLAKMSEQAGADLIEANFSCPQMTSHAMGSDVGANEELLELYCKAITETTKIPLIAKMTPNLAVMEMSARAAIRGGAKGISAINTVKSITNLDYGSLSGMPVINGKSSISGYSGAAVRPIALRFAAQCLQDEIVGKYDFSGIGGIESWSDALDFLLLGCKNVQATTAVMQYGYRIVDDMISGLSHWMHERGFESVDEFIGLALPNIVPAEDLDRDFKIQVKFNYSKCVGCGRCYISCFDGAHQAIEWDEAKRLPVLNKEKCVGCQLCRNVCPVLDCITPGEIIRKPDF